MNILITNDDSFNAKGIRALADIMKQYGNIAVIAPSQVQSGMSMAVSLNAEKIKFTELSSTTHLDRNGKECTQRWGALDATLQAASNSGSVPNGWDGFRTWWSQA